MGIIYLFLFFSFETSIFIYRSATPLQIPWWLKQNYKALWVGAVSDPLCQPKYRLRMHLLWYLDGLVQEGRSSSALAMELRVSWANPPIWTHNWL